MHVKVFAVCFSSAARKVANERESLCKLDTFIGDGDHGVTAERGFIAAADAADKFEGTFDQLFLSIGNAMVRTMGGAIGPLYGAFWSGAASKCKGSSEIDAAMLALCMADGLEKIMRVGKTNEEEKTMIDAIAPCVRAMQASALDDKSLATVATAGAQAAEIGMQRTRDMIARKGRARFLGEKSIGYIDPGAASFAFFMEALAQEIKAQEEVETP